MDIDLSSYVGVMGLPFVIALVALVKYVCRDNGDSERFPKRFVPVLGIGFALLINMGVAWYQGAALVPALFLGVGVGLMASGLYSGTKAVLGK